MRLDTRPRARDASASENLKKLPRQRISGLKLLVGGLVWLIALGCWWNLLTNQPQLTIHYSADQLISQPEHWKVDGYFQLEVDGDANRYFWTLGRLEVKADRALSGPINLTFLLRSAATAGGPDAPVHLLANGQEVAQFRPNPDDQRFQTFRAKVEPSNQPLKLELVSQLYSVSKAGRTLGTMLKSIEVDQSSAWLPVTIALWLIPLLALVVFYLGESSPIYRRDGKRYFKIFLYGLGAGAALLMWWYAGQIHLNEGVIDESWQITPFYLAAVFGLSGFSLLFYRPGKLNIYLLAATNLVSLVYPSGLHGREKRIYLQKRVQTLAGLPPKAFFREVFSFIRQMLVALAWICALGLWLGLLYNPPQTRLSYDALQLGAKPELARPSGFNKLQTDETGNQYLWTKERAGLTFQNQLTSPADLTVELRSAAVAGGPDAPVRLLVNGQVAQEIHPDPKNSKFQAFKVKINPPHDNAQFLKIELATQTFVPSNDGRTLGVMVRSIALDQEESWDSLGRRAWLWWLLPGLALSALIMAWLKQRGITWARYAGMASCLLGAGLAWVAFGLLTRFELADRRIYPLWPAALAYFGLIFGLSAATLLYNAPGKPGIFSMVWSKSYTILYRPFTRAATEVEPELLEHQRSMSVVYHFAVISFIGLAIWAQLISIPLPAALGLGLLLLNLAVFSYVLAFRVMKQESRLLLMLPFGLLVGSCLYGYAVIVNRYLLNLPLAIIAANLELLALTGLMAWPERSELQKFRPVLGLKFELNKLETVLRVCFVVVVLGVLTWLCWSYTMRGNITEARIWHSALTSTLERGNFPPVSPLEPDYPLIYRWTYHHQAAALNEILSIDVPDVLGIFNVWVVVLMFWGVTALLYRQGYKLALAIGGGLVFLLAGSASWMLYLGGKIAAWSQLTLDLDARRNYLTAGSNFDMMRLNPSILFGYFPLVAVVWLWLEWQDGRRMAKLGFGLVAVLIAYLNASNEVLVLLFGGGLGLYWIIQLALTRQVIYCIKQMLVTGGLGLLSLFFSLPLSTFITSALVASERTQGYKMSLNTDHFGSLPTPPLAEQIWVPIFSLDFFFASGFLPLLLLIIGIGAWLLRAKQKPSLLLQMLLLMGLIGFVASISFYPTNYPGDQYRFTQAWYSVLSLAAYAGLVAQLALWRPVIARLLYNGLLLVLSIWVVPTLLAGLLQSTYPDGSYQTGCVSKIDQEAATYLSRQSWQNISRVVVLNGAPEWLSLYNCYKPETLTNIIVLQYGGTALPIGHTIYDHPKQYLPLYKKATTQLDLDALKTLKVDAVFLNPELLKPELKDKLNELESRQILQQVYNQNDRIIYKVNLKT